MGLPILHPHAKEDIDLAELGGRLLYRVNIGVSSEPQSSVDDQRTFNVKAILEFHA